MNYWRYISVKSSTNSEHLGIFEGISGDFGCPEPRAAQGSRRKSDVPTASATFRSPRNDAPHDPHAPDIPPTRPPTTRTEPKWGSFWSIMVCIMAGAAWLAPETCAVLRILSRFFRICIVYVIKWLNYDFDTDSDVISTFCIVTP